MSHRNKTNCYNCGKPVYGSSDADWDGHVFCCRNCRDAYGRDKDAADWAETKEKILGIAGAGVVVVLAFANWPILTTTLLAGGGYGAYRLLRAAREDRTERTEPDGTFKY